jgi:hypothetical protein
MISNNLDLIFVGLATAIAVVSGMLGLRQAKRDRRRVVACRTVMGDDVMEIKKVSAMQLTQIVLNTYKARRREAASMPDFVSKKETFDLHPDVLELAYAE